MNKLSKIFLVLTLFFVSALPTIAAEIYAIGTEFNREVDQRESDADQRISPFEDSIFYSIDPNTGQPTEIGVLNGFTRCTGLDIHPITGEFFAVCDQNGEFNGEPVVPLTRNGVFGQHLLIIDPDTGQLNDLGALDLSRGDFVSDISFRSDSTLFAHLNGSQNGPIENATNTIAANSLAIIDPNTLNVTILGETGLEDNFSAIGFNDADTLFQCTDNDNSPGAVYNLNQTTGQSTFLDTLIYPPGLQEGFNVVSSKDFDDSQGQFLAILFHGGQAEEAELQTNGIITGNFLVKLGDANNETIEIIGVISGGDETQFGALAVMAQPLLIAEVPTLSEYGLIVTVVMLLGAAVLVLRRRQIKTEI